MEFLGYVLKSKNADIINLHSMKIDEMQGLENMLPYKPPHGVVENMKAKSRFYKR